MDHTERLQSENRKPELGCCGCMEKWFLSIVNLILFIVGLAQIGCGIYAMSSDASAWTGDGLANYVVGIGFCVAFIAFLGCFGAMKENKCMLWIYAFLLFWIILAQTVGLTICAIGETYTEEFLSDFWDSLSTEDQKSIEDQYNCCSFNGNSPNATIADQEAYSECIQENPTYVESCWDKVHGQIFSNLRSVTIAVSIVVVSQIMFLFMTMALINGINMANVNRRMSHAFRMI